MSGAALSFAEAARQPSIAALGGKFLLITVAFRRLVQIRAGARPRVFVASHHPAVLAVAEVVGGYVPYSIANEPEPPDDSHP